MRYEPFIYFFFHGRNEKAADGWKGGFKHNGGERGWRKGGRGGEGEGEQCHVFASLRKTHCRHLGRLSGESVCAAQGHRVQGRFLSSP